MPSSFPKEYLNFNNQSTKEINVVVEIDGVDTLLSMTTPYKRIRYGDPDIHYGDPDLVYGGVKPYNSDAFKNILSLESNLTITQKIDPEQGKGSVSTLTLVFVDIDQYVTRLTTPGVIVDEPLGNKFVTVRMGYKKTGYPEDYFVVFRGYLTDTKYSQGKYYLQVSDPNAKRRAQVFFTPVNKLTSSINNSQTTIPFITADYYRQILGPDNTYDSAVKTYIQIGDEVMEYGPGDVQDTQIINVTRGARGTTAASHDANSEVNNILQIEDNVIDIGLKVMLSGWNGDWITDVPVFSIEETLGDLGILANSALLPPGVDAVEAYGLYPGDIVTFSGSSLGNDGTKTLIEIRSVNALTNNLLFFDSDFNAVESPATGVTMSFRSQFDTLPIAAGSKLTPKDVDVNRHVYFRNNFFAQLENRMRFYIKQAERGKDWIEKEIMLPIGAYSITRFGRCSMTIAIPPIADALLHTLDVNTVVDPNSITSQRAINNRFYYNSIKYSYDLSDSDLFTKVFQIVDTESLSLITIDSVLPIESAGMRTDLGSETVIERRGAFLINRYKNAAIKITLKTNWGTGSIIESGDIVLVNDNGELQITNFQTGERNLLSQLFEVIDRQYDIKNGIVTLQLLSGVGFEVSDRFATITPSSLVVAGSTTTKIKFEDSFGVLFPGDEKAKWEPLVGLDVEVHSVDYTRRDTARLLPFSDSEPYVMNVAPALSFTPQAGDIIDMAFYPDTTNPRDQFLAKTLFTYQSPTLTVVSDVSEEEFQVHASDVDSFSIGVPTLLHSSDFSVYSREGRVASKDELTGLITVQRELLIAPSDADLAEGSFRDSTGYYRIL